jgi:hypothetical protein
MSLITGLQCLSIIPVLIAAYYLYKTSKYDPKKERKHLVMAASIQFICTIAVVFLSLIIGWLSERQEYSNMISFSGTTISGKFDFNYWEKLYDTSIINGQFGGLEFRNTVKPIPGLWYTGTHLFTIATPDGELEPIKFGVKDHRLYITVDIYDLDGNPLVEIDSNRWTRSGSSLTKFNYDDKGFEIFDKDSHIAFSVDFPTYNTIKMQGYLIDKEKGHQYLIIGGSLFSYKRISGPETSADELRPLIDSIKFTQLFCYTGGDWLGKRISQ